MLWHWQSFLRVFHGTQHQYEYVKPTPGQGLLCVGCLSLFSFWGALLSFEGDAQTILPLQGELCALFLVTTSTQYRLVPG